MNLKSKTGGFILPDSELCFGASSVQAVWWKARRSTDQGDGHPNPESHHSEMKSPKEIFEIFKKLKKGLQDSILNHPPKSTAGGVLWKRWARKQGFVVFRIQNTRYCQVGSYCSHMHTYTEPPRGKYSLVYLGRTKALYHKNNLTFKTQVPHWKNKFVSKSTELTNCDKK